MPYPRKYPLPDMQIGDVIEVPEYPNLSKYIHKRAEEIGRKFKTKRVGEQRRVQRVA
jgi:hypothetical protein